MVRFPALVFALVVAASQAEDRPALTIVEPMDEAVVSNPVRFRLVAAPEIVRVELTVDGLPLPPVPMAGGEGTLVHDFRGVNSVRGLLAEGRGADGKLLATDRLSFVPSEGYIPEPPGFNGFVVRVINDLMRYPRDGSHPYCWRECPGSMGLVHPTEYAGEPVWEGEGSCFCSGFTLEVLLAAIRSWRAFHSLDESELFGELSQASLRGGDFYQRWQGYGVTESADSAAALESIAAGYRIGPEEWATALPGDFANLSRANGTGHAVIFVGWVREGNSIVGLRYYGCNRAGDSRPDPDDPGNRRDVSGPSFMTERFVGSGGRVLPEYLYLGHPIDPAVGY
jgi:hypothetical protein